MKLKEFLKISGGEIIGDPETEITGVAGIREAAKGDITYLADKRYLRFLQDNAASCVIVKEPLEGVTAAQLKVGNPQYAFARALECFYLPRPPVPGISDKAVISATAKIGRGVHISPFVFIGDGVSVGDGSTILAGVSIGEGSKVGGNCVIHANVTIREKVSLGDRVTVHSGSVIGSDGFGYVFEGGVHYKIPQVGGVVIEDDVEIGSNVSIDRATLGNTTIGRGTKIDNLVQIAHNVTIGEKSLLMSQVGIAGSSELGSFVTLAGQAGVADHTSIDSGTIIAAQAGVVGHVAKGVYSGSPGIPHGSWLRAQAIFAKLPELQRRIRELEARLHTLEKGATDDTRN
ncbi:MAG: UDP-3-O-(3-hydroxymyristoyl)glucosamine N-acyltransferase [Nitrospiraceae bacterium]|nr:UDP-3-O-(3-hydroxymyristoyl)glucosamine N-acyltransferase [Nitrospiraceae bacterium]